MAGIDPNANYPVTSPEVVAQLGCKNGVQARRLTYRTDYKRLPSFHMFGRVMIGGKELLEYTERVRVYEDAARTVQPVEGAA